MIVKNEPFLIEYNVRMGDQECQTILPKLKSDLLDIILACCDEKLHEIEIKWLNKKSVCVVLCSKGYPDQYKKNVLIKDIAKIKLDFIEEFNVQFLILPNDQELTNEWLPLVGEHTDVRNGKVSQLLYDSFTLKLG